MAAITHRIMAMERRPIPAPSAAEGLRGYAAQVTVLLDRTVAETLALQIVAQIRTGIQDGRIAVGSRLPSSRRLADQLQVARNTVVRAYEQLHDDGLVSIRPAAGIFVLAPQARGVLPPALPAMRIETPMVERVRPRVPQRVQRLNDAQSSRLSFDFYPGRPAEALFPVKTWRRLMQSAVSGGLRRGMTRYGDPAGLSALRAAIANHLGAWRGIATDPGQVVIVSGAQEGLSIAARLFIAHETPVVVENPCYQGATFAFEAAGAAVHRVPVDEDGLITARLPDVGAALAYVTPGHQFPTGATLSMARRESLIAWARRRGTYIVEDDYDSDFQYDGSPLPPIAAMAPDCTIHVGTFSKSLGPGLRLGYLVVPPALADAAVAVKGLLDNGNSWFDQHVLAEFIRSGSFVSHLLRARGHYREARDTTVAALRRHFGDVDLAGTGAGLHICWQLPPGVPPAATLEAMARKARLGVYSLASAGAYDGLDTVLARRGIILGYAAMAPRQIEQGIARLSDLVDDKLDGSPGFLSELLVSEPLSQVPRSEPAPRNRHKPALRAAPPARAVSAPNALSEDPMQIVRGIYRYPIKGMSAQPVNGIMLEAGRPFPFDRIFALARPNVPIDRYDPKWAKKGLFVMLMIDEALAEVRTELDPDSLVFRAWSQREAVFCADLRTDEGRRDLERFVRGLVPTLGDAPHLVQSRQGHFMDKPDNVISLINLATLRQLEELWGRPLDPLRFRANFYVDGLRPWQEFDLIGSDIRLGDAVFRVDRRNGRCGATNVNPQTGKRDMDIPGALRARFGHKDLGVYLVTQRGGKVVVGDPLAVPGPGGSAAPAESGAVLTPGPAPAGRFICRGCYYIHDGLAGAGVPFAELDAAWRCPDCGSEKSAFRPYVPAGFEPDGTGSSRRRG